MTEPVLLVPAVLTFVAAAVALSAPRERGGWLGTLLPAIFVMAGGLGGLLLALARWGTSIPTATGWEVIPGLALRFRLDPLAAFFLVVIAAPTIAAALFGIGYRSPRNETDASSEGAGGRDAGIAIFVGAMMLTILADSVLTFLIAWEVMALASFFLVIGDGRRPRAMRAGYIYVVMPHIGTAFLIAAFLFLSHRAGGSDFAHLRMVAAEFSDAERSLVFLLALIGFGTKAGLIPLHAWRPRVYPVAPSHVTALMSGVMAKTALYGLIRVIWEFLTPTTAWWGVVLLVAGAVSGLLGILYALMERDLKRILAWSTVEHIGIITLGLGAAVLLGANGRAELAALALLAALIHVLNHSLFKSLLFLGAGTVEWSTGTRDLERLGGLIRQMPRVAALFLIGAIATAALPPLNGFVGEWLLFQSLVKLAGTAPGAIAVLVVAVAGILGLVAALAVATFARAFGVGFLAQPRSTDAANARDATPSMLAGMGLLAGLSLLLGVLPQPAIALLNPAIESLTGTTATSGIGLLGLTAVPTTPEAAYAPAGIVLALLLGIGGLALLGRAIGGPARTRVSPTWVCGVDLEPRMPYSATAFAKPLRLIFQHLLRPERSVTREEATAPWFVRRITYDEWLRPIWEPAYRGIVTSVIGIAYRVRRLQSGSIRAYLAYVFATLVVVLLLTR